MKHHAHKHMLLQAAFFLLVLLAATLLARHVAAGSIILYPSPLTALYSCPGDVIVWVDVRSRTFFYPGQQAYGRTLNGGFACRGMAIVNGDGPARS